MSVVDMLSDLSFADIQEQLYVKRRHVISNVCSIVTSIFLFMLILILILILILTADTSFN